MSKDYERTVHTTQTFNEVTTIRLMLKRLAWEVLTFTKQALRPLMHNSRRSRNLSIVRVKHMLRRPIGSRSPTLID